MTRRDFAQNLGLASAGLTILTESAMAQRAAVRFAMPPDSVFLNANENPEGPPQVAIDAMIKVLPTSGRYHYQEYTDFYAAVAKSEGMQPSEMLIGAGSSEVLQAAVHAFTSPTRPVIQAAPTFEAVASVTEALGRKVIRVPLKPDHTVDVKAMVDAADRAGGGLIYFCNPNNPTSTITPKAQIEWLVANLPKDTVALIDEAYIHFSESPEMESGLKYVKQGKDVVVTRSYSKIYGMAGLRAGTAFGRPELMAKMEPFRNNVISIVAVRAVLATIEQADKIIPERKVRYNGIRRDLCKWLDAKGVGYIEPHANFMMIHVPRDVRTMLPEIAKRGVAPGRHFAPFDNYLRISIGTPSDMEKFKRVFWEVYNL